MNETTRQGPRRLPVVSWQGREYFVDSRLRQFREVKNPHRFVEFDSPTGKKMLNEAAPAREKQ